MSIVSNDERRVLEGWLEDEDKNTSCPFFWLVHFKMEQNVDFVFVTFQSVREFILNVLDFGKLEHIAHVINFQKKKLSTE